MLCAFDGFRQEQGSFCEEYSVDKHLPLEETVDAGTLRLVGTNEEVIYQNFKELLENQEAYDKMAHACNPYAIRFASNFVEEDCKDADKAGVNLNDYWAFAEGFLKKTAATLTENEVDTLGISCFALACELATRFLDDYITGDQYFKIKYPDHNIVRTRCQIALAKDMQVKMDAILSNRYRYARFSVKIVYN